jgi:hypothetical protein
VVTKDALGPLLDVMDICAGKSCGVSTDKLMNKSAFLMPLPYNECDNAYEPSLVVGRRDL